MKQLKLNSLWSLCRRAVVLIALLPVTSCIFSPDDGEEYYDFEVPPYLAHPRLTHLGPQSVQVDWEAHFSETGEYHFILERKTAAGEYRHWQEGSAEPCFSDTGLDSGEIYSYRISAVQRSATGRPELVSNKITLSIERGPTPVQRFEYPSGRYLWDLTFSPDGEYLACWGADSLRLWGRSDWRTAFSDGDAGSFYTALTFSPSGRQFAYSRGNIIWVRDRESNAIVQTLITDPSLISLSFSPDARELLSASFDGWIRLYDVAAAQLLRTIDSLGSAYSAFLNPDRETLTCFAYERVNVYRRDGGGIIAFFSAPNTIYQSAGFNADSTLLLALNAGLSKRLEFRDSGTWEITRSITLRESYHNSVVAVDISPADSILAYGDGNRLRLSYLPLNDVKHVLQQFAGRVVAVSYSPAGDLVAALDDAGTVKVWSTGETVEQWHARE